MEGMLFTRNRQDTCRLYCSMLFWEIFGGKSYASAEIVVLKSPPIPFPDLKYEKCSFLYSVIPKPE